ncbi:MAG: ABC-type transport auxiliary lipoprotein family protein [Halomonas sp.]|uniref:PqiC family protein n=1 Tax=Halomonas sp. TaxID=1486246 RepID=UPI002ACE5900|nr:ABC-type transport auxiliary lipoprotein family protein [Halomonas sp.]MDZ7852738.1 ABC-type transport auxiliary lipoprotein family protein [Halomonas sp.]
MRMTSWIAALTAILWLTGCASSSPPADRYTLPAGDLASGTAGIDAEHLLLIRPPQLARFLDVEGIVYQLDDITLIEAREHRWADPLGDQLGRGLRDRLAARLADTRVDLAGSDRRDPAAYRLHVEIDRFQGRADGLALAAGRWQLRDGDGELLALEDFSVAHELEADGYPALIRALGRSWDRVASEIAAEIKRLR